MANVILIPKMDEKVRVCVNFRYLNKARPKDDFPLPHIDMLVDSTARHLITTKKCYFVDLIIMVLSTFE